MNDLIFPNLIELSAFDGNFEKYNAAVYEIFKSDFVIQKPIFQGKRLNLKSHPYIDNKEYTYYHFTHSGDIENERVPDLRRMERIRFPKPMINSSYSKNLKVWRNKRGTKNRILIFCEKEKYLVILEDRKNYILPWTAYYLEHDNRIKKLRKEYEKYIKTETA
ncbi:MAG: hypothetical protein LBT56_00260 [Prevotellaceae bacterium]|jgi:hypothetical protein|nr:hypothetical protein [Prevotellaceae bacterium]